MEEAFKRGNHKSAELKVSFMTDALKKEIRKGWNLVLPGDCYSEVPELVLNPMGVVTHLVITDTGEFVPKDRLTHDLSFPGKVSGESINSRVNKGNLEPCMFSFVFSRIIHYIVALRAKYPDSRIWIRKEDIKSAFRRLHMNARTAFRSAVRVNLDGNWYILISLRMPFGGAPCPSEFAVAADLMADTINDLLADTKWDHKKVYSDKVHAIPDPVPLDDNITYAQSRDMSVYIPLAKHGKTDVYVDDLITIGHDEDENIDRITKAPITVIDAIADNHIPHKSIPRDDLVAEEKTKAERAAEEVKVCLGWILDTRRLLVRLPDHKNIGWKSQIQEMLDSKSVGWKDLASILGRLENVAQVLVVLGHFLSNIRHLEILASEKGHNVRLNQRVREDLKLAQKFLNQANEGVSMNLLTFRKPDIFYICDASEYGLGGFSSHGRAWTYTIPEYLRNRAHINLLEYMAQIISLWIDIIEGRVMREDCILAIGDNTSAMGWLRRSNFRQKDESDTSWSVKQQLGRHLASLTLSSGICLYKQWLQGSHNQVADSLSRDNYYLSPSTHKKNCNLLSPSSFPRISGSNQFPKKSPLSFHQCCFNCQKLSYSPRHQNQAS